MPQTPPTPQSLRSTPHSAQRRSEAVTGRQTHSLGLSSLPQPAADLVLLGDLTGRYATGAYNRLDQAGQVVRREERQGLAEHGHRITAAIACHIARCGGSVEQLARLLLHPDHEGGRHARTIALRSGHSRALAYIHRVWDSARTAVVSTTGVDSRWQALEDLAALRERIEVTAWRGERGRTALRVLRAHLTFAETAGGRLHAASERQTAEEAGISRQTLRSAYESILKPWGWLRRLRVGHGREGSTWYLGNGPATGAPSQAPSRSLTTQFPPDPALEEWSTPETATDADIDSTVIARLMGHDAFAHHGLGSAALMLLAALHARPHQNAASLVTTSSVSRATTYRTLHRLTHHGLIHRTGDHWSLTPHALEGLGNSLREAVTGRTPADSTPTPAPGWDQIAIRLRTAGTAAKRSALHAAERAAYQAVLERLTEHRTAALVIVHDGRQVLVPTVRPDEVPAQWRGSGGTVLPPGAGRPDPAWRVASDGRLILITPADQRSYDELAAAHAQALSEWESTA